MLHCSVYIEEANSVTVEVATADSELISSDGAVIQGVKEMSLDGIFPSVGGELSAHSITVYGSNFVDSKWLMCRFGKSTPTMARFVSSTGVVCSAPPMRASNVAVSLSINEEQYTAEGPRLSLVPMAELMSASPSVGSIRGGVEVTLSGRGFEGGAVSACKFGEQVVGADVASDETVVCTAPPGSPAVLTLRLLSSDGTAVAGLVSFTVLNEPKITGMHPRSGVVGGGSSLMIYGEHLGEYDLSIKLGTTEVEDATVVSSSLIVCKSGAQGAGAAPVSLEYSGLTESVHGLVFRYFEKPSVQRIAPSSGPQEGGTPVLVYGAFKDDIEWVCRFGRETTQAQWLGSSTLKCLSPKYSKGMVALDVSFNSVDFSSTSSAFEFEAGIEVQGISPTSGPVQGGTAMSIFGHNFMQSETLRCLIGAEVVPARFINADLIVCTTPVMRSGEVSIAVSNNGVDIARVESSFTAYEQTAILSMLPSMGPTRGGTAVNIVGEFGDLSDVSCRFGAAVTAARLLSSSTVRCFSPAAAAGKTTVHVLSGRDVVTQGTNLFSFEKLAVVRSVVPSSISESGGRVVTVLGESFEDTDHFVCRFGGRFLAQSLVRSSSQVVCQVDSVNLGNVSVEVSANGQDFTSDFVGVMVSADASLRGVAPSTGTVRGGTPVTLLGSHFTGEQVHAHFGSEETECAVTTSSMLSCMTPPNAEGLVTVEVVGASTASTRAVPVVFSYGKGLEVLELRPSTGQSSGSTAVTVLGRNFVESSKLGCRFGEQRRVEGLLLSSSMMVCVSPKALSEGEVSVEVTSNGVDYSLDYVVFAYKAGATVERLVPSAGAASSDHVITVHGSNFERSSTLTCIGKSRMLYPAKWLSNEAIVCSLPAASFVGNMTIEVSNNGVDVSTQGVQFALLADMHVLSVQPTSVIEWGGETVTVIGLGFPSGETLFCNFGLMQAIAQFVSTSMVECMAPAHKAGVVSVHVTDETTGMASEDVPFMFAGVSPLKEKRLASVSPSFGPVSGGTRVLISASGFTSGNEKCVFGTVETGEAVRVSESELECISPERVGQGCVTVHVVDEDGRDFNLVHLQFCYEAQASVKALSPSSGHWKSQHLVAVSGDSFLNRPELVCRLGEGIVTQARFMSSSEVLCVTSPSTVGSSVLEVSNNGQDFTTDGVTFEAKSLVKIMSVEPSVGMLTSGLEVTVTLEDAIEVSGSLVCRFGSEDIAAVLKDDHKGLTCRQPVNMAAESVDLILLDSRVQISTAGEFVYVPTSVVESIVPSRGPIDGGTPITLIGSDFSSQSGAQLVCRIGSGT
ncbi:hypothetical protein T484DRAFT_1866907, partial [Baffinella frigidus]